MILYVDGDSYTTPGFCVDQHQSYWSLFGQHAKADSIVNYAYMGKSPEGMIRSCVRFAVENSDQDIFFLLGFGPIERFDVGYQTGPRDNPNPAEHGISSNPFSAEKERVIGHVSSLTEANFYSNLVLLGNFLDSRGFKYMFHFMPVPLKRLEAPLLTSLRNEVDQNPRIVNLFEDTYFIHGMKNKIKPVDFDEYGWMGHHGWQVNGLYADYLIQHYQKLYAK
jgi:hypothetical protein